MYFPKVSKVLVICVLVSFKLAEANTPGSSCDLLVEDVSKVTLNCSRRDFGTIPNWPEQINTIDKETYVLVTFSGNSITNVTQLSPIPGKKIAINFKSNRIIEIEDDAFRNIQQLVYLDLSKNRISGQVLRSEIFQGPYEDGVYREIALESLNLGYNEIHSLDRYLFKYAPNLKRLFLNNNPIEILDHVSILAISSATNLEVLDLSKTDIDSIPLDAFRGLVKLNQIDLSNNRFVTVPESLSLVGSTLEYLTFNNNPIVELNDDSFVGLSNVIELEVGENDYLDEVKRSTFTPLKSLKILHLCHNRNLRYISHNAFRGLKDKWTLKEVYLDNNDLSELSPDLMPWSKLEVLGMTGNNWLCNCDLANIVNKQGAADKFKDGEVPYCAAPMRLSGEYITNITVNFCPMLDNTFVQKKTFHFSDLRPKHILWSILGVALVAVFGMMLGLFVNFIKKIYKTKFRSEPIRYINITSESSFA